MKKWIKAKLGAIKKFVYRILFTIFGFFTRCVYSIGDWFWDIAHKFGE